MDLPRACARDLSLDRDSDGKRKGAQPFRGLVTLLWLRRSKCQSRMSVGAVVADLLSRGCAFNCVRAPFFKRLGQAQSARACRMQLPIPKIDEALPL